MFQCDVYFDHIKWYKLVDGTHRFSLTDKGF